MNTASLFAVSLAIGMVAMSQHTAAAIVTVGVYDENTGNTDTVDVVSTGSSLDLAQTQSLVATAFANNLGGVWNFDTAVTGEWEYGTQYTSFDLTYGVSQSQTLGLSVTSGTGGITANNTAGNAISGAGQANLPGLGSRVWTPGTALTMIAITTLDQGNTDRQGRLVAKLQDNSTISTAFAAGTTDTLHVLTASAANPIVQFTWDVNATGYVRWDDLAFVVIPEPSAALLGGMGLLLLLRRRRCH